MFRRRRSILKIPKIVLLGSGAVGKSSLIQRFLCGMFPEKYDPTIEECFRRQFTVDGEVFIVEVVDTVGSEISIKRGQYLKESESFLLIYSITSRSSFEELELYRQRLLQARNSEQIPMILVGNKCDLEEQRNISKEEGQKMADAFGCLFFETSAKEDHNCYEVFAQIAREMRKLKLLHCATAK